jgi:hypothetical protein
MDEKNTKKALFLSIALSLLLILSGLTFEIIRTNPMLLVGFLLEHAVFTGVGVLFALIPIKVVPAPREVAHLLGQ